jgi:monomeric sarcosine oxidase
MRSCDIAVIGAGVFGSWTAYRLAREGVSVLLIDAYGAASNRASSGGESRIIRMAYGPDEVYTRFSYRSLALWKEFFAETGHNLLHRTGVLGFAAPGHPSVRDSAVVLKKCGVPFEDLSGEEIERRWPQFHFEAPVRGLYEPESGALMARRAVQSVAASVEKAGGRYRIAQVLPPAGRGRPVGRGRMEALPLASSDTVRAAAYVFACGPWLPKVFPELLGQRIFPTRQEVFFFGIPPGCKEFSSPELPVWLDRLHATIPYGLPSLENRGLKVALDVHGPAFDPDAGERTPTTGAIEETRRYVASRFPALADAPVVESRVCQYENTSNGDFLIDRHPDFDNVWIAGGGSGHGFKHGPAVGEYLTDRIQGRGVEERRFSLRTKETVQRRAVY